VESGGPVPVAPVPEARYDHRPPARRFVHGPVTGGPNVASEAGVKTFPSAKIRNVALLGHGNAGKTTLTEALLFSNGLTQRMGRVEDGNTVSDFDPEEHKRGISTSVSVIPIEYEGFKLNILDTPGYADFVGDV